MRPLFLIAGSLTSALGFIADQTIGDPALFQGALTLGGGFVICAIFSKMAGWKWHGIIGAGVLALLGAARCLPSLLDLPAKTPAAPFQAAALVICTVVLIAVVRTLMAERARRQLEALEKGEEA
ncbi:MAG: hypothetical protein AAGI48_13205 [Verrucomicrobiota bacterium]